jgi:hypothetical protein
VYLKTIFKDLSRLYEKPRRSEMQKTKASPLGETPDPRPSLAFFSNNSPLTENEWLVLRLVALTTPRENEPRSITRERARVEVARQTLEHFKEANLSPIFGSFEFEALKLQGVL